MAVTVKAARWQAVHESIRALSILLDDSHLYQQEASTDAVIHLTATTMFFATTDQFIRRQI